MSGKALDLETWTNAGYVYPGDTSTWSSISNRSAVEVLKSLPLKKYRLKDDPKRDVFVANGSSRDEMRTRIHVGVIDSLVLNSKMNPLLYRNGELEANNLRYFHLRALADIADDVDYLHASIEALGAVAADASNHLTSINRLGQNIDNSTMDNFESLSDLAAKAAAVEAEVITKQISVSLHDVKHVLRMKKEDAKLNSL